MCEHIILVMCGYHQILSLPPFLVSTSQGQQMCRKHRCATAQQLKKKNLLQIGFLSYVWGQRSSIPHTPESVCLFNLSALGILKSRECRIVMAFAVCYVVYLSLLMSFTVQLCTFRNFQMLLKQRKNVVFYFFYLQFNTLTII